MFPLKFSGEVNHEETRVMALSSSEDRILSRFDTPQQSVTDRPTDLSIALCTASYADAL